MQQRANVPELCRVEEVSARRERRRTKEHRTGARTSAHPPQNGPPPSAKPQDTLLLHSSFTLTQPRLLCSDAANHARKRATGDPNTATKRERAPHPLPRPPLHETLPFVSPCVSLSLCPLRPRPPFAAGLRSRGIPAAPVSARERARASERERESDKERGTSLPLSLSLFEPHQNKTQTPPADGRRRDGARRRGAAVPGGGGRGASRGDGCVYSRSVVHRTSSFPHGTLSLPPLSLFLAHARHSPRTRTIQHTPNQQTSSTPTTARRATRMTAASR